MYSIATVDDRDKLLFLFEMLISFSQVSLGANDFQLQLNVISEMLMEALFNVIIIFKL